MPPRPRDATGSPASTGSFSSPITARSGTTPSVPPSTGGDPATELANVRRVLASKVMQLSSLETERDRLRARILQRDQRIRDLEASATRSVQRDARIRELEQRVSEQAAEIEKLKAELADALAWTPKQEDDFTRIKGIGPKYAAALRELGVHTFAEMAAWTPEDVIRIAGQLKLAPTRIQNAGWVQAARALAGDSR